MTTQQSYPVVDLFAGPGGLGEGFASLRLNDDAYAFHTALSIEKDPTAHQTLELRHFFRMFAPGRVPDAYYAYLAGNLSREQLFKAHPEQAMEASLTAWNCELGKDSHLIVQKRINKAISRNKRWVLVGGPPCQAYSRVGRSRMKHMPGFAEDPRHQLYREYLQILADHLPPVFVMENVKGLLSATLKGTQIISEILRDLHNPRRAIYGHKFGRRSSNQYTLYSLSESGPKSMGSDPASFVVKAEDYGIPQARHRIFIVGVRNDLGIEPGTLVPSISRTVRDFIGDLPPLRSALSREADSAERWVEILQTIAHEPWFEYGRTNGLADVITRADEALTAISKRILSTKQDVYSITEKTPECLKDERLTVLLSHEARSHMNSDLHRYFFSALYAQVNGSAPRLKDFPPSLLPMHINVTAAPKNEEGENQYSFADRFRVQLADEPATTITSHISKDGHYFIHYDPAQCRSLTVREAARLQTFPDNYKFEGNRTEQYQQVGNAVPPLLAMQIAKIVYEVLRAIP